MLWPISYLSVIFFSLRYLYVIFRRVSSLLTTPLSKYIPKVKGKQIFFSQIFRFFCERLRHGDIYLGATHRICSVPWGNAVRRLDMHCDTKIGSATQRSAVQRHDKQKSLADLTNFRKILKKKAINFGKRRLLSMQKHIFNEGYTRILFNS